jgi:hypothetical protein
VIETRARAADVRTTATSQQSTWTPARDLVSADRPDLVLHLEEVRRVYDCAPQVAATLFWKQYSWWVVDAAFQSWPGPPTADKGRARPECAYPNELAEPAHVLPDLGLDSVRVQVATEPPYIVVEPTRTLAPLTSRADLAGWLAGHVLPDHLQPFVERLHTLTRAGRRLLWGSVAHAIAYLLLPRTANPSTDVPAFLDAVGSQVADLVEIDDTGDVVRRTCCLAYRCKEPTLCSYCPIRRLGSLARV